MEFSKKIKQLRVDSHLTQEQLAEKMNVSKQAISKWETGNGFPDILNIVKLCDIYGVSLDDLLREDLRLQKKLSQPVNKLAIVGQLLLLLVSLLFIGTNVYFFFIGKALIWFPLILGVVYLVSSSAELLKYRN
ncbi:hypothetical protein A5881_001860 [Enterococcus termitis]|nr:hypothetical protein A5881_001819 [Enterococcus termitis]